MHADWQDFLVNNGAKFEDDQLISFGNPKAEQQAINKGSILTSLSDRGLIEVHGEDAESFLQNQFTNDIRNVISDNYQENAWCTPKGRMIANFRVFKRSDRYYLSLSSDMLDIVIKKLRMYVMMSKVTIEDVSSSLVQISYAGESAVKELEGIGVTTPSESGQHIQQSDNSLSVLRIAGAIPHFEMIGSADDIQTFWESSAKQATPVGINAWHYLNILSGTPFINQASSEAWIPQMVNYITVGGVDFKKGCYPGQEIVARLNYLGKTKRRMYRLLLESDKLPKIGDAIASESDKKAGGIVNLATNPDGKVEALAVLKIAEVSNKLFLADDESITVSVLDLPYLIEDE